MTTSPGPDDGAIRRIKRLTLSLTWDHRVLDGAPAAELVRTIGRYSTTRAPSTEFRAELHSQARSAVSTSGENSVVNRDRRARRIGGRARTFVARQDGPTVDEHRGNVFGGEEPVRHPPPTDVRVEIGNMVSDDEQRAAGCDRVNAALLQRKCAPPMVGA